MQRSVQRTKQGTTKELLQIFSRLFIFICHNLHYVLSSNFLSIEATKELYKDLYKELYKELFKELHKDLYKELNKELFKELNKELSKGLFKDLPKYFIVFLLLLFFV